MGYVRRLEGCDGEKGRLEWCMRKEQDRVKKKRRNM